MFFWYLIFDIKLDLNLSLNYAEIFLPKWKSLLYFYMQKNSFVFQFHFFLWRNLLLILYFFFTKIIYIYQYEIWNYIQTSNTSPDSSIFLEKNFRSMLFNRLFFLKFLCMLWWFGIIMNSYHCISSHRYFFVNVAFRFDF